MSVTVNVADINDHAPVFESTSYSATISEVRPSFIPQMKYATKKNPGLVRQQTLDFELYD